jgi:hypothetical protein
MGYYTRVLSKRSDAPTHEELERAVHASHPEVALSIEEGDGADWISLLLSHQDGTAIAAIERNTVADGSLGAEEIDEFIEDMSDCRPASAVQWLASYLPEVKTIYAFQHLRGTRERRGDEALRVVSDAISARGQAISQADGEGFSNEDGDHILWQFSDRVSGPWWMAVLQDERWVPFQMDLGNREQRQDFFAGRVPPGAKTR